MVCDTTEGECVCAADWSDTDRLRSNGCEDSTPGTPQVNHCDLGAAELACTGDWTWIDGSCMRVFCPGNMDWYKSQTECQSHGGDLARITNDVRNDWISDQGLHIWFGMFNFAGTPSDPNSWSDINGNPQTYLKWAAGKPEGSSNCALTNRGVWPQNHLWDNYLCGAFRQCYACEIGNIRKP